MNIKFWRKQQKRSVDTGAGAGKAIQARLPSVPSQPIDVTSTNSAMQLAAVYRYVSILSGTIASLPLQVKRKKNGYFSIDCENELHSVLTRRPNKRLNSFDFMQNAIIQMVNNGNAYILIRRSFGEVSELILCANNSVCYDKFSNRYVISDGINHISGVYDADDIIHLKNKSLDGGYTGVSTIYYASRILSISASADNQNLQTFQNGTKVKALLYGASGGMSGIDALDFEQTSPVADRVEAQLNSGKDIIAISEDLKFQQLSINPVDAQLLETKKFSVLDVCRFYGVNPDKAFAGQSTNYKASEMGQVSFLTDTLQPILSQIEAEFNAKLVPDKLSGVYKINFDLEALYQTDLTTRAAYDKSMYELGVFTTNHLRMKQGIAPVDGGDTVMVSCNVAPINSAKIHGEQNKELPKDE